MLLPMSGNEDQRSRAEAKTLCRGFEVVGVFGKTSANFKMAGDANCLINHMSTKAMAELITPVSLFGNADFGSAAGSEL